MDEIKRLQNFLPTLRACANWSVQEFAEMLGVTRQTINNLEKVDGGTEMSKIQYLAIRSLFSYEIEKNNNKKLSDLLYYLVDHPEKLNQEKQAMLSQQAKVLSSAIKGGASATDVDDIWTSILEVVGITAIGTAIGAAISWIDSYMNKK